MQQSMKQLQILQALLEVNEMVKWYVRQISMGRMNLEDVPKRWHDKVEEALKAE